MLQRLRRRDPPRRIQNRHLADQIPEPSINKMPCRKRFPGFRRVEGAREGDKTLKEWVFLADLL